MPLTAKGKEIMANLKKEYGEKKGEEVFYAMKNSGKITGVDSGSNMRFYTTSKLSDHISETPEGYLLCEGVPITRTGEFLYKGNELIGEDQKPVVEPGNDGIVHIHRDEDEVFNENAIRSFEGKPFTIEHPDGFVSPENWNDLSHGTIQNVRRGEGDQSDLMIADILVTTEKGIEMVKSGQREISCGYDAEYKQMEKGKGRQTNIIGNHVALVSKGRAGNRCAILDNDGLAKSYVAITQNISKEEESMAKFSDKDVMGLRKLLRLVFKDQDEEEKEKVEDQDENGEKKKDEETFDAEEQIAKIIKDRKTKDQDFETKIKKLEGDLAEIKALLKEILEMEESETEDDDEEKEKKESEDDDEEKEKKESEDAEEAEERKERETADCEAQWPEFISRADVLVPGIRLMKPTRDHRRTMDSMKIEVLGKVIQDKDFGSEVKKIIPNGFSKLTSDALNMAFLAASELITLKRNGKTYDSRKAKDSQRMAANTVAEINKKNKEYYRQDKK